jgi:hypothetical protein
MIYVMAGNRQIADTWARHKGAPPEAWRYISDEQDLLGLEAGTEIRLLHRWFENPAAERFKEYAAVGLLKGVYA